MNSRTYKVMPAPWNAAIARHWALAIDDRPVSDNLYRGEALDLALRLADTDRSTRHIPACVLFADEDGIAHLIEAPGQS